MSGAEALAAALDDHHFDPVVPAGLIEAGIDLVHHFRGLRVRACRPVQHDASDRTVPLVAHDAKIAGFVGQPSRACSPVHQLRCQHIDVGAKVGEAPARRFDSEPGDAGFGIGRQPGLHGRTERAQSPLTSRSASNGTNATSAGVAVRSARRLFTVAIQSPSVSRLRDGRAPVIAANSPDAAIGIQPSATSTTRRCAAAPLPPIQIGGPSAVIGAGRAI